MKIINGLKDIINDFDTFILDQWGVLHNGGEAFPEAIQALQFLKEHNKKVVILSNSGNTGKFSHTRLQDSGISRALYLDVLTSGEHMRHNFNSGKFKALGKNALFFSWDEDASVLEDCGLTESAIQDASFILCCGVARGDLSHYTNDLKLAYQRNLELVVSNPDLVAMNPDGSLKICPGSIAKAYQEMGGIVHWHGKPQSDIYKMCNELVGGWDRAIAVGDSLEHDIAGANGASISSLFITSGIHSTEISDQKSIVNLCNTFSVKPSYCTDWFKD
ncbi:HAD-superfamily subfamily IIA hydrolase like protein [Psychromonas ingrahamii 37]|uniref:HAD-superfamily subfamily IIA hydrolase like protein n=1 Tax=Psychromonas ingrahamii (strain DSM 17664 / CCUG 51855 / 37) TaxID=357804 RepID=A1SXF1_PSYIN|nr:TIGR01459 family HAD-type hydrolase [Psychromonas ingrahamii]ABM04166.1 HAD-superfamily subfamily IIA hydrolase like protein [Psychromonas ingrahamii 37]